MKQGDFNIGDLVEWDNAVNGITQAQIVRIEDSGVVARVGKKMPVRISVPWGELRKSSTQDVPQ